MLDIVLSFRDPVGKRGSWRFVAASTKDRANQLVLLLSQAGIFVFKRAYSVDQLVDALLELPEVILGIYVFI